MGQLNAKKTVDFEKKFNDIIASSSDLNELKQLYNEMLRKNAENAENSEQFTRILNEIEIICKGTVQKMRIEIRGKESEANQKYIKHIEDAEDVLEIVCVAMQRFRSTEYSDYINMLEEQMRILRGLETNELAYIEEKRSEIIQLVSNWIAYINHIKPIHNIARRVEDFANELKNFEGVDFDHFKEQIKGFLKELGLMSYAIDSETDALYFETNRKLQDLWSEVNKDCEVDDLEYENNIKDCEQERY